MYIKIIIYVWVVDLIGEIQLRFKLRIFHHEFQQELMINLFKSQLPRANRTPIVNDFRHLKGSKWLNNVC